MNSRKATQPQPGTETEEFFPLVKKTFTKGAKTVLTGAIAKWAMGIALLCGSWFVGGIRAQAKQVVEGKVGEQIHDSLQFVRSVRAALHVEMEDRLRDDMVRLFMRQQKAMEATIPGYTEALDSIDRNQASTERETKKIKSLLENANK
jgi:hypothetical protein